MNKVLIIDDEEITRSTFSEVLRSYHFSTCEAGDGRSGIGIFEKEMPDAVLLDLMMPGMDGIETMQEMRKIDPDVPVIFVTAHSHIPSAVEAVKKGAYDFIVKPPNYKMLVHAVNRAVEQRRLTRESVAVGAQLLETQAINRQLEREITERKKAEEALRQSEERLRLAVDSGRVGLWEWQIATGQLIWSDRLKAIFGLLPDVTGLTLTKFLASIHPEDLAETERAFREALKNYTDFNHEYRILWPDGTVRWIVAIGHGQCDAAGQPVRMLGAALDITERKRAGEALRKSEENYRNLVEMMSEGLGVQDKNGLIAFMNNRACEMLGYELEELIGKPITFLFDKENQEILREQMAQRREGKHQSYEIAWTRKDGGKIFTTIAPSPLFDERGNHEGSVAVFTDITERKLAQAALERYALEMKKLSTRLVEVQESERRNIARELHDEIGQALTGIKLNLEGHSSLPGKKTRRSLDEAQKMVSDLMDKVRDMSLGLRPAMLDDLGLLPTLLWHFRRYTAQTNIHLTFKHSRLDCRFEPQVETAVYRVVQEALTNVARHASTDKAEVLLLLENDALEIYVHDSGKGFDPGAAFARGDAAGLSGMRERAELLGGQMTIKSAPGAGTSLTVRIPLQEQSRQKPSEDA